MNECVFACAGSFSTGFVSLLQDAYDCRVEKIVTILRKGNIILIHTCSDRLVLLALINGHSIFIMSLLNRGMR